MSDVESRVCELLRRTLSDRTAEEYKWGVSLIQSRARVLLCLLPLVPTSLAHEPDSRRVFQMLRLFNYNRRFRENVINCCIINVFLSSDELRTNDIYFGVTVRVKMIVKWATQFEICLMGKNKNYMVSWD